MNILPDLMDQLEENMMKAVEAMKHDFMSIRTGKASSSLIENITAEYYGTQTRIRDMAGISTPDAKTIMIQPWDKSALGAIEKAIIASNLGISPVNDGKVIRLPVPPLSEERRQQLSKQVKSRAEDNKISIRNIRRDGNESAKKSQKNSEISEDELKAVLDAVQKLTDDYIRETDDLAAAKEKEIMTV